MNSLAKILDEMIDRFGFGCEFRLEDLFAYFENPEEILKSLTENGLIEKNQITSKYYLTDIFTCNNFLKEYLNEEEIPEPEIINAEYALRIKKHDLSDFFKRIHEYMDNVEKILIKKRDDDFSMVLKLKIPEDSTGEFERALQSK